jgi:hypothetical protein
LPEPNQILSTLPQPKPQNQSRQLPSKNQKRHQRIPSQPIQLSNSKTVALNANQLKRHRFRCLTSRTLKAWAASTADQPRLSTRRHTPKNPGKASPPPKNPLTRHKKFLHIPHLSSPNARAAQTQTARCTEQKHSSFQEMRPAPAAQPSGSVPGRPASA